MRSVLAAVLICFTLGSCLKGNDGFKCLYDPCEYQAPGSEVAAVEAYLASNSITATKHCSGLYYIIEDPGTGAQPTACGGVHVSYTGRLTNGTVFDSNTIGLGLSQVIAGWANGVPLIKSGGKIRLFIPPSLGYGSQAQPNIPANSILIFDIELHAVL